MTIDHIMQRSRLGDQEVPGGQTSLEYHNAAFFDASSLFLQVTRHTITTWISLNFGKIPSLTLELAALKHLKIDE